MHNTNEDLLTRDQMICSDTSSPEKIHSTTPSVLLTFTESCTTQRPDNGRNISESKNEEIVIMNEVSRNGETTLDNLYANKTPTVNENEQPEVIFNAASYKIYKNCCDTLISQKNLKRYNHTLKLRKIPFKFRNTRSTLNRTVMNYNKRKQSEINTLHVKKGIEKNVKSKVLKKGLAKEKLLEDRTLHYRQFTSHFLKARSLLRLPLTRKSFPSHSSKDVRNHHRTSSFSIYDDHYNINLSNSIMKISSDICVPYKMDIINVAVAVAYNKSTESNKIDITHNQDKYILFRESLTSTQTITIPSMTITSKPQFNEVFNVNDNLDRYINTMKTLSDTSNKTLVDMDSAQESNIFATSDHDNFFIARTSSDFNRSNLSSNYTVTSNSTSDFPSENTELTDNVDVKTDFNHNQEVALCDTVINMETLADTTPSTSSAVKHDKRLNNIIIKQPLKTYFDDNDIGVNRFKSNGKKISTNILTKPIDVEKDENHPRTLNLPNESTIKWQLENQRDPLNFSSEKYENNYPTNFSDMWDKFISVLDRSIKRLEETLAEKISKELKKLIDILDQYKRPGIPVSMKVEDKGLRTKDRKFMSDKEVAVDGLAFETNERVQCDLVGKSIIDELMTNLDIVRLESEAPVYTRSREQLKEKIFKHYVDVLSAPIAASHGDIKNAVPISAATSELNGDIERLHWSKNILKIPVQFFRENAFIITSVPTFFAILLCIYGLILLVIKP